MLFLSFLICHITLVDFYFLNQPCVPGINPTWSWYIILFLNYWIWFTCILMRIFASVFIRDIDLIFPFLGSLCLCFHYQDNTGRVEDI